MEFSAMSENVTFEQFEKTVFEFTKALVVNDNNGNVSKRVSDKASKLAKEWYQGAGNREVAFQELLATLDGKIETEQSELKKKVYATAGERTYK